MYLSIYDFILYVSAYHSVCQGVEQQQRTCITSPASPSESFSADVDSTGKEQIWYNIDSGYLTWKNFISEAKEYPCLFFWLQDIIMNLLSTLQPAEAVEGEWNIYEFDTWN